MHPSTLACQDGSIRDYQLRTTQWTIGKNFDATGGFGPAFVTSDELPAGATGLKLETRLNGKVMQSASTSDLIFDIASIVSYCSQGTTLEAGTLIITGTPEGVGMGRDPQVWMKDGDVVTCTVDGIGSVTNTVVFE